MTLNRCYAVVLTIGMFLLPGAAFASYPSSVVGTWSAYGNNSAMTLTISSQDTVGPCYVIAGTIGAVVGPFQTITGFYCKATGRISFLRLDPTTNETYQVYTGNLSLASTGLAEEIGGTMSVYNAAGTPGEYNFSAEKTS